MKVKVKIGFRDKYTKEYYSEGKIIEITEARYKEILKKGKLVEKIPDKKEAVNEKKTVKETGRSRK